MKVLMFGWEFPPHISGGLGTACLGLTQSLLKQHVEVLFVVPRLEDDQLLTYNFLISASGVTADTRSRKKHNVRLHQTPGSAEKGSAKAAPFRTRSAASAEGALTSVRIPSRLQPYSNRLADSSRGHFLPLMDWNYPLATDVPSSVGDTEQVQEPAPPRLPCSAEDDGFRFTGTYGENLMEEVTRYSEVAAIIASQFSFDVIHAHDWMTFPAGIAAKRKSGKPLVVHVHSTEVDRAGSHMDRQIWQLECRGMKEADRVITVSNWTKQIVVSRYRIPESKILVVHNGIQLKDQPVTFSFPAIGSHFVTFLGRITYQKGPLYYVEAAKKVLKEFPKAHFIVAGAGDLLPQIIERVAELNMSTNFHFTGFLSGDQVDQVWSLTDVYVMPSVSEPFGLAPLEAIQQGVPVILSNQSGVSEVMPHAIKVDFWNIDALAAAICSVLRYESLSEVLRQRSKEHIRHLTWDKAAWVVKALYHELELKE